MFGLSDEVAHFLINAIGDVVRAGNRFAADALYSSLTLILVSSSLYIPSGTMTF